jgi:DNA-binding NarL/FixJ family response regulator
MRQTRVLVADDSEGFGVFLGRFVASHSDMVVVGRAVNGREAVSLTDTLDPDVVLMDLYMGEMDGFQATRLLAETHPDVKVVVLTGHRAADNEQRSLEAGARAFVLKAEADQRLIGVIRGLSTGMIDSFHRSHRAQGPGGPGAPS